MAKHIIFIGGNEGPITVDTGGGTYDVGILGFASNAEATFEGPGTYFVNVNLALFANYTIIATNGAVVHYTDHVGFATTPNLVIDGASTISIVQELSAFSPINVDFTGAGGGHLSLRTGIAGYGDGIPTVTNFSLNDSIGFDAKFKAGEKYVYTSTGHDVGVLALEKADGTVIGSVNLIGNYTQGDFSVTDVNGHAELVCDIPCFLPGTLIATPDGDVPVEALRAGDLVLTRGNGVKPVIAVRSRVMATEAEWTAATIRPVRIAAGALGGELPRRDLWISPDHSMFLDGALIPARLLVNGLTITQPENDRPIEYIHVELQPHDIIFAEGAASETFLDIGNAAQFVQPGVVTLFARAEPKTWEDACAPIVLAGPRLSAIRAGLLAIAAAPAGQSVLAEVA